MLEYALAYAQAGIPVFPVYGIQAGKCTCGKSECSSVGKHPLTPNGLKDATTDEKQIQRWFANHLFLNIGMITGSVSGLWVLDVDPRHKGNDSLQKLMEKHGSLPETLTVQTGGGGRHLFFLVPEELTLKNRANIKEGLDVRGEGGYVVAAPSFHMSGKRYQWETWMEPVHAPEWLLELVLQKPQGTSSESPVAHLSEIEIATEEDHPEIHQNLQKRAKRYLSNCENIAEGNRNSTAFSIAGHLLAFVEEKDDNTYRLSEDDIFSLMQNWNEENSPPLPEDELQKTIHSALKNGTPRELKIVHHDESKEQTVRRSPDDPLRLSQVLLREYQHQDSCTLCYWTGSFYLWKKTRYLEQSEDEMASLIRQSVQSEFEFLAAQQEEKENVVRKVTKKLVSEVEAALKSEVLLPANTKLNSWIGEQEQPTEIIALENGLFDLGQFLNDSQRDNTKTSQLFLNASDLERYLIPHTPNSVLPFL